MFRSVSFCALFVAVSAWGQVPNTYSYADSGAWVGTSSNGGSNSDGPANRPTNAMSFTNVTNGGGSSEGRMEAWADYASLRALGTVTIESSDAGARAGSTFPDDPDTAAVFEDRITIGGGGGPHTFRLYYELDGWAGMSGLGTLTFGADLGAQVSGSGITVLNSPGILRASGSAAGSFYRSDFVEISATDGATMNVLGTLGAFLMVNRLTGESGVTSATLDVSNTGFFHIVPDSAGTTFTSASGTNYLVPEPATLSVLAFGLVPFLRRRKR